MIKKAVLFDETKKGFFDKAQLAKEAIDNALNESDVNSDYISYEPGSFPDSSGASDGTIGAYLTNDYLLQKLKWNGSQSKWDKIASPIVIEDYLYSDKFRAGIGGSAENGIWEPDTEPDADDYTQPENHDADGFYNDLWEPLRNNNTNYISRTNLGTDYSNTYNLYKYVFEPPSYEKTIIIGCNAHGGEVTGQLATYRFFYHVVNNWTESPFLSFARWKIRWVVIPMVNPWGVSQDPRSRQNANGVDINRNFDYRWDLYTPNEDFQGGYDYKGTAAFSEPETQIYRDVVLSYPEATSVIDVHDFVNSGSIDYPIYVPHSVLNNERTNISELIFNLKDNTEEHFIRWNGQPSAFNYFADQGYNSSNPEFSPGLYGTRFFSNDMTKALRWFGNLFLTYANFSKSSAAERKGAFTYLFRDPDFNRDIPQGSSYQRISDYDTTITVPTSGILLYDLNMVIKSDVDNRVFIGPYIGQDTSDIRASDSEPPSTHPEQYIDNKADERDPIYLHSSIPVMPNKSGDDYKIRIGLWAYGESTTARIFRYVLRLTFIPSDAGNRFKKYFIDGNGDWAQDYP